MSSTAISNALQANTPPRLSNETRVRALKAVEQWVHKAGTVYGSHAYSPSVHFDLTGRVAGRAYSRRRQIGLNAVLLQENPEEFEKNIIPHELAHLIVCEMYGRRAAPHGKEWRNVMVGLGVAANRCHQMDVSRATKAVPVLGYRCGCAELRSLTPIRHKRSLSGKTTYTCRVCRQVMRYVGQASAAF